MSDLVKRLREAQWAKLTRQLCHEAADEIERLQSDYATLLERWKEEQRKRIEAEN
jgi:hypothetical protein